MKIGIIGAGEIGGTLACHLLKHGGVWTRAGDSSPTRRYPVYCTDLDVEGVRCGLSEAIRIRASKVRTDE